MILFVFSDEVFRFLFVQKKLVLQDTSPSNPTSSPPPSRPSYLLGVLFPGVRSSERPPVFDLDGVVDGLTVETLVGTVERLIAYF